MAFRPIAFAALCAVLFAGTDAGIVKLPPTKGSTPAPATPAPADRPALTKYSVSTLTAYVAPTNAPGTFNDDVRALMDEPEAVDAVPPVAAESADGRAVALPSEGTSTPTPTPAPPARPVARNADTAIRRPYGMVYDKARRQLWVGDNSYAGLYRVDPSTGAEVKVVQGAGLTDGFNSMPNPYSLDLIREGPNSGDVLVASTARGRPIRHVDMHDGATRGNVTTLAGGSGSYGYREGKGAAALLRGISDIVMLPGRPREAFFTDRSNHCVRKVDLETTQTSHVFGRCAYGGYIEGTSTSARMNYPWGIVAGLERELMYVADQYNNIVRTVNVTSQRGSTLFGRRSTQSLDGYAGSGAASASIYRPGAMSRAGDVIFVVSANNYRLSAFVLSKGYLKTIFQRQAGFFDAVNSGPVGASTVNFPEAMSESTLFFADFGNSAIRRVDLEWAQGVDTTVPDTFPNYALSSGASSVAAAVAALAGAVVAAISL